jgi:hypothetical protein
VRQAQPRVPTHRRRGSQDALAERPALTIAPNARGAPDGVKRSLLSRSQEAHCSDEKWESPLLAHVCCQDGVDDAILSPRPGSHHQYAWWSVEVPRGASTGKVAVVGAKLCPERRRSNGAAVELQEEPVAAQLSQVATSTWSWLAYLLDEVTLSSRTVQARTRRSDVVAITTVGRAYGASVERPDEWQLPR